MRGSGTVNTETIIGLMVGPGLGTLAAAALLEGFSAAGGAAFAFTAFLGGLYVYGATIPVLAPITLALRYWRIDYILASQALASRATTCPVQREVGTSDHAPVTATFT